MAVRNRTFCEFYNFNTLRFNIFHGTFDPDILDSSLKIVLTQLAILHTRGERAHF